MKRPLLKDYNLANVHSFLYMLLELYKEEFAETGDKDYLNVMNELNETLKLFRQMREQMDEQAIIIRKLREKYEHTKTS